MSGSEIDVKYEERRLRRILHTGTLESCLFLPIREVDITSDILEPVNLIAAAGHVNLPLQHCKAAYESGLVDRRLLFLMLSACLKIDCNKTRTAIYQFLSTLLVEVEDLFDFIYYHKKVFKKRPYGRGAGLRRLVQKWYLNQEPLDLAPEVMRFKKSHRWSHADLITLFKVRSPKTDMSAVLMVLVQNFDKAWAKYESDEEAKTVMYYLKAVRQLKKCKDPDEAVRFIQNHSFDIDVLPNHLLDHSKVWVAALGKLTLVRILAQLKTMTRRGLLSDPESPVMKCLLHCLSNTEELKMSKLQPGLILTAMAGVSRKWTFPNQDSELDSPHPTLSYALENMLNNSLDNVAKTPGRVLVVIDSRKTLSSNMCWGTHGLPCSKAAAFIILGLRAGGATVEVHTRGLRGMCPIDLTQEETVQGLASRLLVSGAGLVQPLMVVNWARDQRKVADLVLMLTDSHTEVESRETFWKELDRYRRDVGGCKETKFVYSVLGSKSLSNKVAREGDLMMLDICGMDSNYLRILQAFLADCF